MVDAGAGGFGYRNPLKAGSEVSPCSAVVLAQRRPTGHRARREPVRQRKTPSPGRTGGALVQARPGGHARPGMARQLLFDGIPENRGDRAQPTCDGRAGAATGFKAPATDEPRLAPRTVTAGHRDIPTYRSCRLGAADSCPGRAVGPHPDQPDMARMQLPEPPDRRPRISRSSSLRRIPPCCVGDICPGCRQGGSGHDR